MKTALKSQLSALQGKVATVAPQSAIARLIHGEIKGGEAKHDYIMSVVASAMTQALKGNQRDIPEAVKLCQGKSAKARAYHAGFHAVADMVAPVKYTGKLDAAENLATRREIALQGERAAHEFEIAYLCSLQNSKIESAFNRASKAKAAGKGAVAVAGGEGAGEGAENGGSNSAERQNVKQIIVDAELVDVGAAVSAVVDAIATGFLQQDEMTLLRAALATYDAGQEQAAPALLAA